jgi:diguanylate cyclase (GGDEF)-like protein/PAS domain S-box-containing protein
MTRPVLISGLLLGSISLAHANLVLPEKPTTNPVRVGVYENKPKIFLSPDKQPTGILGDVLMAIAQSEGWGIEVVPCEWQACLKALQEGQIDLMPDVALNEQRAQIFDFHKTPALLSWSQLYKKKGTPISSLIDLKGKRIAVVPGSVQAPFLENLLANFGIPAQMVNVATFEEGFKKVAAGSLDTVATNRFFGDQQAIVYQLEPTAVVFQPVQLFYATAKGRRPELLAGIDRKLGAWQSQSDSPYGLALQHWMQAKPQLVIPRYLWLGLGLGLGLLVAALLAATWLRRQVVKQTAHVVASEKRLNTILDSVDAYIYIKDPQLRYQYANSKVCALLGQPLSQVIGQTDAAFFDPATAIKLRINDQRVLAHGERVEEEETYRSTDSTVERSFVSVKLPLRHPNGQIYALCGVSTDITKHKQAEETIFQLAFYDPLTKLPNRRLLQDRVQQFLATVAQSPHGAALMFIDVDNFKDINDTLGHDLGDKLLVQMAGRMNECLRAQDTLARLGGDEFVVMLVDLSTQPLEAARQAQVVAQKILNRLSEPYTAGEQRCQSSVSIGVALVDVANPSREELFKQADLAVYQAKAAGRNTLQFFNPAMQAEVVARTTLETELYWALQHKEFELHYQVQVTDQNEPRGYEALVRWQHPTRGLIGPGDFIGATEASGLIVPLGRWILHTACEQLVAWSRDPARAQWTLAVNVSAYQFKQADFVDVVRSVLTETRANAQLLELELTESQLVEDVSGVIAKMDALRALGVRLSLDDFGTGYSSLAMLKRLPLHQLKIDQAFVRDMLTDPQDASIIRAIIMMGESLSLEVIAEGVELAAQRDALLALGCHHFQGYLFGRPAALASQVP